MPAPAAPPPRRAPAAATPMAFARAIEAAYRLRGQDAAEALRRARITPSQLRQPNGRITAAQMETLSAAAMRELDDEGLAAFGRRLPWGSYGMLARASLTAPNLGVALKRWCRHHGLIADEVRLALTVQGGDAVIALEELRPLPAEVRELSMAFVLRNVHGLACWYVDSRIPLAGAGFPYPAPAHAPAYALMFPGGPVSFGAARGEIRFDAGYLPLPLRRDEKALAQMLQRALHLTVLQYRRDRLLVPQVRQALAAQPGAPATAASVAARLHVSARTLHRQLAEEGATLQALKDEVRFERAKELLLRTALPVKLVASEAGFRNAKSFSRAFMATVGVGPASFRARSGPLA